MSFFFFLSYECEILQAVLHFYMSKQIQMSLFNSKYHFFPIFLEISLLLAFVKCNLSFFNSQWGIEAPCSRIKHKDNLSVSLALVWLLCSFTISDLYWLFLGKIFKILFILPTNGRFINVFLHRRPVKWLYHWFRFVYQNYFSVTATFYVLIIFFVNCYSV